MMEGLAPGVSRDIQHGAVRCELQANWEEYARVGNFRSRGLLLRCGLSMADGI